MHGTDHTLSTEALDMRIYSAAQLKHQNDHSLDLIKDFIRRNRQAIQNEDDLHECISTPIPILYKTYIT